MTFDLVLLWKNFHFFILLLLLVLTWEVVLCVTYMGEDSKDFLVRVRYKAFTEPTVKGGITFILSLFHSSPAWQTSPDRHPTIWPRFSLKTLHLRERLTVKLFAREDDWPNKWCWLEIVEQSMPMHPPTSASASAYEQPARSCRP